MKKIILALMCCFLLLPNVASADNSEECQNPYSGELVEKVDEFEDKDATVLESYAMGLFESIINMFNLNTINRLVMGNPYCIWYEEEQEDSGLVYGLFPEEIKVKVVDPAFTLFSSVYFLTMALAMLILGIRKSYSFMGISRVTFGEELMMYAIATFCMIFYFFGIDWVFLINWSIVTTVKEMLQAQGVNTEFGFLMSDQIITAEEVNFSDILFLYAEWILLFFLNFVYILRLFSITILMILGGVAIIALLFEKTRYVFKFWFIALLGNVFMQSVHAIYLAMVLLFFSLESSGLIFKFIMLIMFLPISSMMMGWLSLSDGLINVKAAQDTVNSAAKGAAILGRGKRMMGSNKNNIPSADKIGKTRISTAATSSKALNTIATVAKTTNAALGATAGMVIGPGGAVLGGMAGGMVAKHAIQTPRNVVAGVKGIKDTVKAAKSSGFSMANIADRRQFYGNMGESIGTFVGKGELGRSVGEAVSGVSRQRLANSNELGGLGGVTINDIVAKHPGAQIQFQQTNQGSGFYMNENGEMKLISPLGHADPSLQDGEVRLVDFEARPSNFVQGADGQYAPNLNQNSDSPLARVSDAYFTDANGTKYQDMNSDASKLNPMDYYKGGTGTDRTLSDRFADRMPFSRNSNWSQ